MKASIPTPQIGHLTSDDYEEVYEPAEDSFILLDALEEHAEELRDLRPSLCVEIGSGSGIVSSFIHALLKPWSSCIISTDINVKANGATIRTAKANGAALDAVRASLVDGLRIHGLIDLFVFNPPYVPTDEVELTDTQAEKGIGGAWAGGDDGMLVTNRVLEILPSLLSPQGRFYLVAIDQNKPQSIIDKMSDLGLAGQVVLKRRAGGELLSVICFTRS